jgi:hypothetical protein
MPIQHFFCKELVTDFHLSFVGMSINDIMVQEINDFVITVSELCWLKHENRAEAQNLSIIVRRHLWPGFKLIFLDQIPEKHKIFYLI